MKGVSAVIAIILILMIVVALAALAYTWFTGIFSSLTSVTEEAVETSTTAMSANFLIETAFNTSTTVHFTLRNTGTADIDLSKLGAYVDDVYYDTTGATILPPKEYSSLLSISSVPNPKGKTLKITIEQGLEKTAVIQG